MVIKDDDYYLGLDLDAAAEQIKQAGTERGKSQFFGEAINALVLKSERQRVTVDELIRVLGLPDFKRTLPDGHEVWEYAWVGTHGPFTYTSATPFEIDGDLVLGMISPDEETRSERR